MGTVHTKVSAVIDASPAKVYGVFADYRKLHPQILPKPYFGDVIVEKGGKGAGTIYRTSIKVMGRTTEYHMEVTEPEPGRRLVETDKKLGVITSFIIEPLEGGKRSRVTLATDWTPSAGIMGLIEKLTTPFFMRRLYNIELDNVQAYLATKKPGSSKPK
jgi:hypothetical protein